MYVYIHFDEALHIQNMHEICICYLSQTQKHVNSFICAVNVLYICVLCIHKGIIYAFIKWLDERQNYFY